MSSVERTKIRKAKINWYYKHIYICKYCGYKFNAVNSFVCPKCQRTN